MILNNKVLTHNIVADMLKQYCDVCKIVNKPKETDGH